MPYEHYRVPIKVDIEWIVVARAKMGAVIREVVLVAGTNSDASGVSSAECDGLGSALTLWACMWLYAGVCYVFYC